MTNDTLRMASRSCCCSARPAVIDIMPAAPGRGHETDLLLCGHHFRTSRDALQVAGAFVYDRAGTPIVEPARVSPRVLLATS
jgi:hypothetical protein